MCGMNFVDTQPIGSIPSVSAFRSTSRICVHVFPKIPPVRNRLLVKALGRLLTEIVLAELLRIGDVDRATNEHNKARGCPAPWGRNVLDGLHVFSARREGDQNGTRHLWKLRCRVLALVSGHSGGRKGKEKKDRPRARACQRTARGAWPQPSLSEAAVGQREARAIKRAIG